MNHQPTFNVLVDLRSLCRQPLQHGVRDRVALDPFCGIGAEESNQTFWSNLSTLSPSVLLLSTDGPKQVFENPALSS